MRKKSEVSFETLREDTMYRKIIFYNYSNCDFFVYSFRKLFILIWLLFKRSTIYFKVKYYQQALSSFHLHSLYQRIFFFSFTRFLFPNTVWILTNRLVYINTHYVKFLKFHFFFSASNFITKDITARINTFLFPIVRVSQRCHLGTLKTFFSIHLGECSLS